MTPDTPATLPPPYDSRADTIEHMRSVAILLNQMAQELLQRANVHDLSKLEEPEKSGFDNATAKLKGLVYGSPEYKAALEELQPILRHHYAHNRHHPEWHPTGVDGMNLIDVVELLCDWEAATKRMANGGDIRRSLEINRERFKISPQLATILGNTIRDMGW